MAEHHDQPTVVNITLPVVYTELRTLSASVDRFIASYEERERHRETHEQRIASLERWKAAWPASALVAIASAVAAVAAAAG